MAPKHDARLRAARDMLVAAGLRTTTVRLAVLRTIDSSSLASPEDLIDDLASRGIDSRTVYRVLKDLTDSGILTRTDFGDHTWRYALSAGHSSGHEHPHFLCSVCHALICLEDTDVKLTPRPRGTRSLQVLGVCDEHA